MAVDATTRAALVDYFREEGSVMIATEAGAEGINLQFCSLVINYDLTRNPQRIEPVARSAVLDALVAHAAVWSTWASADRQFVPHPATWLNGKRWEDEVEVKIAQDKPPVFYRTLPDRPEGEACTPEAKAILSKLLGKDFSL
jgi:hypothetical protein